MNLAAISAFANRASFPLWSERQAPKNSFDQGQYSPEKPKADLFEKRPPGWTTDMKNDWKWDGHFLGSGDAPLPANTPVSQIPAILPSNGAVVKGQALMVNGILTDTVTQKQDLQALADLGYSVVGVHNDTRGMIKDSIQVLTDKLGLARESNQAITTTKSAIKQYLDLAVPLHVVGHSHGALIASIALSELRADLFRSGLSESQVDSKLSSVEVSTLGGSASSYPKGPNYRHFHNNLDFLSATTGRGILARVFPAENEKLMSFTQLNSPKDLPPWKNGFTNRIARTVDRTIHGAQEVYLPKVKDAGQKPQ